MNLDELVNQFLVEVAPERKSDTHQAYLTKLNHLKRFIGENVDAGEITREKLEAFKEYLLNRDEKRKGASTVKGKLSRFTIRSVLVTTRFLFSWAYDRGLVTSNPMQGLRIPKEPPAQPKAVSADVAVKLIETAAITGAPWERSRNVALLYCFRDTGCRVGGLVTATLDHFDWDKGYLFVIEKGDQERPVFLSDQTITVLNQWLQWREQLQPYTDHLFVSIHGTPLTRGGIYKIFRKLATIAKIDERFNPHSFRHAFARDAIENGIDMGRLSQLMGHSSIDVTNRYYSRWDTAELADAHQKYTPMNDFPAIYPVMEV